MNVPPIRDEECIVEDCDEEIEVTGMHGLQQQRKKSRGLSHLAAIDVHAGKVHF